jgi:tetrahedral aminopeptidase
MVTETELWKGRVCMILLKKLCGSDGIASHESTVRQIVEEALAPLCEEVRVDVLGNVIARRGRCSSSPVPVIMLAAHMDEIGFMVSSIDAEKGFLRINPVGGFDPSTLVAQRVTVHTESGPLRGVMGTKPVHIMTEAEKARKPDIKRVYIDLGLPPEEVVEKIDIGDMVTLERDLADVGECLTGKALDNRAGLFVMIETMKALGSEDLGVDVVAVATVQEEVGVRGAQTSAFGVEPDLAIALDVTVASDVPDAKSHEYVSCLGKGVAIKLMDGSAICDRAMVKAFRTIAEEKDIPHQLEILPRGGTDAGAIQRSRAGVRTAALSIPTRYLHSTVEMAHKRDIEATIALLTAFLQKAKEISV